MGINVVEESAASFFRVEEFTSKMKAAGYSEILVFTIQTTWNLIPEGSLFNLCCENLKSHV
jgi:hypothetical protein